MTNTNTCMRNKSALKLTCGTSQGEGLDPQLLLVSVCFEISSDSLQTWVLPLCCLVRLKGH